MSQLSTHRLVSSEVFHQYGSSFLHSFSTAHRTSHDHRGNVHSGPLLERDRDGVGLLDLLYDRGCRVGDRLKSSSDGQFKHEYERQQFLKIFPSSLTYSSDKGGAN